MFPNFPVSSWCSRLPLLLFFLTVSGVLRSQDSTRVFHFSEEEFSSLNLADYIRVYPVLGNSPTAEEILELDSEEFVAPEELLQYPEVREVWGRFSIQGLPGEERREYLSSSMFLDTTEIYRLVRDQLVHEKTMGTSFPLADRAIPLAVSNYQIVILPDELQTFYYRAVYSHSHTNNARVFSQLYLIDQEGIHHRLVKSYSRQYFFAGFMILFSLISFFLFFIFKERVFLTYTGLILALTGYFLFSTYKYIILFVLPSYKAIAQIIDLHIAGTVLFCHLFVSSLLALETYRKKLYLTYRYFAFSLALYAAIFREFLFHSDVYVQVMNVGLLLYLLLTLIVIVDATVRKRPEAKVLLISAFLLIGGGFFHTVVLLMDLPTNSWVLHSFQIGVVGFTGVLLYGLFNRITDIQREKVSLKIEREKSRALLFNVLPSEVAEELLATGESPARHFEEVTVLFTDFRGFTQIAGKLSPQELVDEINSCFRKFDEITERHQIEKIKTIGDAYLAAGGLHQPRTSEPWNVVEAGLEMQQFINERKLEHEAAGRIAFDMRVGIHTGPVVAGIVGIKKFQYDIWGDTVNMASRMESSGVVGRVNISQATHRVLKNDSRYRFEPRGKIAAKGKGEIEMWLVDWKTAS